MIKFRDNREDYELEVAEKQKEIPKMVPASYWVCVKGNLLRSMDLMGILDDVVPNMEATNLSSSHIGKSIQQAVEEIRKKEPDVGMVEAALNGMRMPMSIEDQRMRVGQMYFKYFERM